MNRPAPHPATTCAPLLLAALLTCACTDDMKDQPRLDPMEAAPTIQMTPVPDTIRHDRPLDPEPPRRTPELLQLGRDCFNDICAACHARDGFGLGVVVQRGHPAPPSLHEPRLRDAPDAHILTVITDGQGKMPPFRHILTDRERHAVLAYVRALQRSRHTPAELLTPDMRSRLEETP